MYMTSSAPDMVAMVPARLWTPDPLEEGVAGPPKFSSSASASDAAKTYVKKK